MACLVFHGRVLPATAVLTVTPQACEWRSVEWGTTIRIQPIIEASVVRVDVDVDYYEACRLGELTRRALGYTEVVVDLTAFCTGRGLTTVLDSVEIPNLEPVMHFAGRGN